MSEGDQIKAMLKEALLYRDQGLVKQAGEKFAQALKFIEKSEKLRNNTKLIDTIKEKIRGVEKALTEIREATEKPELSKDVQDLIKKSFSFSKDKEAASIEGALALAKFGQYKEALIEFKSLLKGATMPIMIGKNIIRCHLSLSSPDGAVAQFEEWLSGDLFSGEELKQLGRFLETLFKKKGIKTRIPEVKGISPAKDKKEDHEAEELDVSSVSITLESGPKKGEVIEFEVSLQSGNTISIIIPANKRGLINTFQHGMRLSELQCYSFMGFFKSRGIITGKSKVTHGKNQGDYMLDIKLEDL